MPTVAERTSIKLSGRSNHSSRRNHAPVNRIGQFLKNDKTKLAVNFIGNGGAAALNLITFFNSIYPIGSLDQESLEKPTEIWTKFATGSQGFITAIDQYEKKNPVPLVGNLLEIPIAIFSSGRNLWLFRGISQGLGQFFRAIDQREIFDKKGKPVLGANGKPKIIGGDFSRRGWQTGFTTTIQEIPKMLFELIQKPSNFKKLTHSLALASTTQTIGGITALFFHEQIGAIIRNASGIGVDLSFMLDENKDNKKDNKNDLKFFGLNFSSWFTRAGVAWMGAAVFDEGKRIPGIEKKIPGLNYLVYFFDRGASILYTIGNLNVKSEDKLRNQRMYQRAKKVSSN